MSPTQRSRFINPRLGIYFGIFASAFAGLVLLLLIVEQLGTPATTLGPLMLAVPVILYVAIGVAGHTRAPLDFFASGRRVPAAYNGLALAATAITGALKPVRNGVVAPPVTGMVTMAGLPRGTPPNMAM